MNPQEQARALVVQPLGNLMLQGIEQQAQIMVLQQQIASAEAEANPKNEAPNKSGGQ